MSNTRRTMILTSLIPVALAVLGLLAYFHLLLPSARIHVSDGNAHAYYISDKYILLIWQNKPFMIYPEDRWVGRISDYRNKFHGKNFWPKNSRLVFWPRGSYDSVPLGDPVKGNQGEKFKFSNNNVLIRAFLSSSDSRPSEISLEVGI